MIKLKYLSHSSFLVTCGKTKIVFDPWLKGQAYYKQWFLWPLAAKGAIDIEADAILISHGHEDHLHSETLKSMSKNAHVFFPFQWRQGIKGFLNHLGFEKTTEAINFKEYLIKDIKVTYISFSLESVVVIEYQNEVLVNINDALNSNHENAVSFILNELNERWPKIDYLLSGWSGASYFPNQIRYPGKNDIEIGKLREQYFANNFCKFTQLLQPKWAIPFCPGFILLKPENKWINHVKFPRSKVLEYYKEFFENSGKTQFICPYPGDVIESGSLNKHSNLHQITEDQQYQLAYKYYENEFEKASNVNFTSDEKVDELIKQLQYWVNYNKQLYHRKVLQDAMFSVKLEDTKGPTYLNIFPDENQNFIVEKSNSPLPERKLIITTATEKLLYVFKKIWGGDVLTIGYGLLIEVYDQLSLEKNLDIVCVRLITRYPMARKGLLKSPVRAMQFYLLNPKITSLWIKQKIELKP